MLVKSLPLSMMLLHAFPNSGIRAIGSCFCCTWWSKYCIYVLTIVLTCFKLIGSALLGWNRLKHELGFLICGEPRRAPDRRGAGVGFFRMFSDQRWTPRRIRSGRTRGAALPCAARLWARTDSEIICFLKSYCCVIHI